MGVVKGTCLNGLLCVRLLGAVCAKDVAHTLQYSVLSEGWSHRDGCVHGESRASLQWAPWHLGGCPNFWIKQAEHLAFGCYLPLSHIPCII